jgi:ribokinase
VRSVIVTLGAKGAIFAIKDVYEHVPAEKNVKVVDTTAAGDTFVGAYAVELVRNERKDEKGLLAAVAKACKAAARTVEKEGAQSAIPWADEVER